MANDRETLEEISTWIRVDFHEICPWQAHGGRCAGCPLGGAGNNCIFDKIADKVDAAAKRERTEIEADALAVGGIVEAARKGELSKTRPKNAADFGQFGNAAAKRERGNLDALERACEEVLDAETLKAVVAAKVRIQKGGAM